MSPSLPRACAARDTIQRSAIISTPLPRPRWLTSEHLGSSLLWGEQGVHPREGKHWHVEPYWGQEVCLFGVLRTSRRKCILAREGKKKKITCPAVNDSQASRRWVKMDSWGSDWLDFQEPASSETVKMTGKSEPCMRATITSYTSVTFSLTDHECPLTSMQYIHSPWNCTSGSIRGHPTMSEVSLTYKLWIRGKYTCVCVHTCTHGRAPVMDFTFIGYDIVQGPVGLLGTRCFCVPHFFN